MKLVVAILVLTVTLSAQSTTPPRLNYPSSPLFTGPTQVNECGGASGTVLSSFTDPLTGAIVWRITDANFDPAMSGNVNNKFAVSNGGSAADNWISQPPSKLQPRLLFVTTTGNVRELVAFNPATGACYRPYFSSASGNCPITCTTHGGWSIAQDVDFDISDPSGCTVTTTSGSSIIKYVFPSDVFPSGWANNPCAVGTGPPAPTTVFNFIENSPASCVGTACNCLPSDFGTVTWVGEGGTNHQGTYTAAFSGATYNRYSDWAASTVYAAGSVIVPLLNNPSQDWFKTISGGTSGAPEPNWNSTCPSNGNTCTDGGGVVWTNEGNTFGQDTGIYVAHYVPGTGCIAWNTKTGNVTSDPGFSGGPGLTCTASGCTGNSTGLGWTGCIHQTKGAVGGAFISVSVACTLSGSIAGSDPVTWIPTGATFYVSEATHTSGHFCGGYLGLVNPPGSPIWGFYYRLQSATGSGTPQQINLNWPENSPALDNHCGYQDANQNDTSGVMWSGDTTSQFNNGGGLMPFDCAPCNNPGWGELDVIWNNGSQNTLRAAYTWNSGGSNVFSCAQNIFSWSPDGWFASICTDMFQQLGSVAGGATGIGGGPFWLASKVYPLNYWITPHTATNPGGFSYEVTTAGTAGVTEPATWNQTVAGTQSDGSVTWTNEGVQTGTAAARTDVILYQFPTNFVNSVP